MNFNKNFKSKRIAMINKDRVFFQYNSRDTVYIISPLTSQLHTASRKVMIKYVGPNVMYKIIDTHNYLSIREVLFETELKFCSKVTSFCSQTWLLLLVCLGKCFPFEKPKDCCSIQF